MSEFFSKPKTQYVPVVPNVAPPATIAAPAPLPAPGGPVQPLPTAPTIAAPAPAPVAAQVTQAGQSAAATIAQRAGRTSTVLTTRMPRGTGSQAYSSGAGNASNSASPYASKTLG